MTETKKEKFAHNLHRNYTLITVKIRTVIALKIIV